MIKNEEDNSIILKIINNDQMKTSYWAIDVKINWSEPVYFLSILFICIYCHSRILWHPMDQRPLGTTGEFQRKGKGEKVNAENRQGKPTWAELRTKKIQQFPLNGARLFAISDDGKWRTSFGLSFFSVLVPVCVCICPVCLLTWSFKLWCGQAVCLCLRSANSQSSGGRGMPPIIVCLSARGTATKWTGISTTQIDTVANGSPRQSSLFLHLSARSVHWPELVVLCRATFTLFDILKSGVYQ